MFVCLGTQESNVVGAGSGLVVFAWRVGGAGGGIGAGKQTSVLRALLCVASPVVSHHILFLEEVLRSFV